MITKLKRDFIRKAIFNMLLICLSLFSYTITTAQTSRLGEKHGVAYQDNYQRVTSGYNHYLEIKNGKLYSSGLNTNGQLGLGTTDNETEPTQVGTDQNWVAISAGESFSIGIKADGTLWAWGKNTDGQLGDGTTTQSNTPLQIGSEKWISVSAGSNYVLAIQAGGTLWAWGGNMQGQLGNGTNNYTANSTPIQIGTETTWSKISAGYWHSLALKADGTLWAWGGNHMGQLGDGTTSFTANPTPVQIGSDSDWKTISTGGFFSTAIKANGTLWAWGDNYYGQVGNGSTNSQTSPLQIGTDTWKSVFAGRNHALAIQPNGSVWVWGDELGSEASMSTEPSEKSELYGIVQVTAGDGFSFALDANGYLHSWGKNNYGQLGQGTTAVVATPTMTESNTEEVIAAASGHGFTTFTLYSDGTIKGWGLNSDFQLGVDTNEEDQYAPISIPAASNDNIAIVTGFDHTLVLKSDGSIWGWGDGESIGNGTSQIVPEAVMAGEDHDWIGVAAGSFSSAAIKADGSLWAWGSNYNGELGTGDTSSKLTPTQVGEEYDWVAIAKGASHTIALKANGTLWGWGRNYAAEAGGGANTNDILTPTQIGEENNWVSVSAGSMSSFAIKADGTIWGWGAANMGQLGTEIEPLPTKVTEPTKIGTDSYLQVKVANWSGFGLLSDGTVKAWSNFNTVFGDLGMNDNNNYPTPTIVPNQNNVVQLSNGQVHKTILKANRKNLCTVGRNANGELGIGNDVMSINSYQCGIASHDNAQTDITLTITTLDDVPSEINEENGTLQLIASLNPEQENPEIVWSITSGADLASISEDGLVTAIQDGTIIVRAKLADDSSVFDQLEIIITNQPIVFCTPLFQSGVEPITYVGLSDTDIDNTTSAATSGNVGYEDYTSIIGNVALGQTYTLTVKGNTAGNYKSNIKVYFDWDNSMTFEESEGTTIGLIENSNGQDDIEITADITIPDDAVIGQVRMRVLKRYITDPTFDIPACNNGGYGQAEDYTLNIQESLGTGNFNKDNLRIYPNPTTDLVTVQIDSEINNIQVYNQLGQLIVTQKESTVNLSNASTGIYMIHVNLENGTTITQKIIKK